MIEIPRALAQKIVDYITVNPSPNARVADAVAILMALQDAAKPAPEEVK